MNYKRIIFYEINSDYNNNIFCTGHINLQKKLRQLVIENKIKKIDIFKITARAYGKNRIKINEY